MSDCKHNKFKVQANVARLHTEEDPENITGYSMDITVKCDECGEPFEWVGLPGGYSPSQPRVSFDGTELRAPIRPSTMKPIINKNVN